MAMHRPNRLKVEPCDIRRRCYCPRVEQTVRRSAAEQRGLVVIMSLRHQYEQRRADMVEFRVCSVCGRFQPHFDTAGHRLTRMQGK